MTDVHEAYPGHFLQALWMPKVATKVRKLLLTATNVEGWAHYAEQMVVEEGFADSDPRIRWPSWRRRSCATAATWSASSCTRPR